MSVADYGAIRRRLLNPPNGCGTSTELDIVAQPTARRIRVAQAAAIQEARRAEADYRRRQAIDLAIRKALQDSAEAHRIAERLIAEDKPPPKPPTIQQIVSAVAREFRISIIDLLSQRRSAHIVLPRMVAMYLARKMTFRSLPQIAKGIGDRDHTTAFHAIRKIERLLLEDLDLAARVASIRQELSTALIIASSCVEKRGEGAS